VHVHYLGKPDFFGRGELIDGASWVDPWRILSFRTVKQTRMSSSELVLSYFVSSVTNKRRTNATVHFTVLIRATYVEHYLSVLGRVGLYEHFPLSFCFFELILSANAMNGIFFGLINVYSSVLLLLMERIVLLHSSLDTSHNYKGSPSLQFFSFLKKWIWMCSLVDGHFREPFLTGRPPRPFHRGYRTYSLHPARDQVSGKWELHNDALHLVWTGTGGAIRICHTGERWSSTCELLGSVHGPNISDRFAPSRFILCNLQCTNAQEG
jgi:hypothetical protein